MVMMMTMTMVVVVVVVVGKAKAGELVMTEKRWAGDLHIIYKYLCVRVYVVCWGEWCWCWLVLLT